MARSVARTNGIHPTPNVQWPHYDPMDGSDAVGGSYSESPSKEHRAAGLGLVAPSENAKTGTKRLGLFSRFKKRKLINQADADKPQRR